MFGLNEKDQKIIMDIFKKYREVTEVHIFGSRAKGTSSPGSDVDLAIINEGVANQTILHIKSDLDESSLPYKVDIINFPNLNHADLKAHILRVGKIFYKQLN